MNNKIQGCKTLPLIGLIFAVGCAHSTKETAIPSGKTTSVIELQEAAISAAKSIRKLDMASDVDPAVELKVEALDPNVIGMAQTISVDWHGPLVPLVKKIADIAHYRVKIFGDTPALPPLVSLTKTNTFLSDILKDATLQVNNRVRVVVYPSSQVIEVHYLHANL